MNNYRVRYEIITLDADDWTTETQDYLAEDDERAKRLHPQRLHVRGSLRPNERRVQVGLHPNFQDIVRPAWRHADFDRNVEAIVRS